MTDVLLCPAVEESGYRLSEADIAMRNNQTTPRPLPEITLELHKAIRRETNDVIAIGDLLREARAQVKHGEWLPWLKGEFALGEQTARNYMNASKFAKQFLQIPNVGDLKLHTSVIYFLSQRAGDPWSGYSAEQQREAIGAVLKAAAEKWLTVEQAESIVRDTLAPFSPAGAVQPRPQRKARRGSSAAPTAESAEASAGEPRAPNVVPIISPQAMAREASANAVREFQLEWQQRWLPQLNYDDKCKIIAFILATTKVKVA